MENKKSEELMNVDSNDNRADETAGENVVEEIIERPYKLRKLKDGDLFPLLKILKKIGIKDYKKAFIQTIDEKKAPEKETDESQDGILEQIGIMTSFDIAEILIEKLPSVLDEAYELWADISGIPSEEIKDMEFGTLPLMIIDTFSEAKNTSFFKVFSKFLS